MSGNTIGKTVQRPLKRFLERIDIGYCIKSFGLFIFLVAILFMSYVRKLGYLHSATLILFGLVILICFIYAITDKGILKRVFWIYLMAAFMFALANKVYRLHTMISRYMDGTMLGNTIVINLDYLLAFVLILIFFKKIFLESLGSPTWFILFGFAICLKGLSIVTDIAFHDITEDYFEVFSLFWFTASFISYRISNNKK